MSFFLCRNGRPHETLCVFVDSLRRQVTAINHLADHGMFFWDYGNAFLLEASKAGRFRNMDYDCVLCVVCQATF